MLHSKPFAEGTQGNVEPTLDLAGCKPIPDLVRKASPRLPLRYERSDPMGAG